MVENSAQRDLRKAKGGFIGNLNTILIRLFS